MPSRSLLREIVSVSYAGFYTGFFPREGKFYNSVNMARLGGSGGMPPRKIFDFTPSETASGGI